MRSHLTRGIAISATALASALLWTPVVSADAGGIKGGGDQVGSMGPVPRPSAAPATARKAASRARPRSRSASAATRERL